MAQWQSKKTMRVIKFHGENFCGWMVIIGESRKIFREGAKSDTIFSYVNIMPHKLQNSFKNLLFGQF